MRNYINLKNYLISFQKIIFSFLTKRNILKINLKRLKTNFY